MLCVLLFISCGKDKRDDPKPYFNSAAGSTWNYVQKQTANGSTSTQNFTVTATGRDTSIGSKMYKIFTNSAAGAEYKMYANGEYYQVQLLPAGGTQTTYENLYLKDNVSAGNSWTQNIALPVGGFPITLVQTNTIDSTGITKTVNGNTYNGVIKVRTNLSMPPLPGISFRTDMSAYYARNYGLIYSTANVSFTSPQGSSASSTELSLLSANLK